jgi:hypothetical protein
VLELSLREALELGNDYIGTEHILLGLIREGEGVAARVLVGLGASLDRTREQVIQLLDTIERQGTEPGRRRSSTRIVGSPEQLEEIVSWLGTIDTRLAAIERHLGIAPRPPASAPAGSAESAGSAEAAASAEPGPSAGSAAPDEPVPPHKADPPNESAPPQVG